MIARAVLAHAPWRPEPLAGLAHRSPKSVAHALKHLSAPVFAALLAALLLAMPAPGFAQIVAKPGAAASAAVAPRPLVAKTTSSGPSWAELTPMQQKALTPLALSWNSISDGQKRKWLEISKNYPSLTPEEQATLHSRMNEWVTLSPQQRAQARLNFARTKELSRQLTPEEKKAKWESYQALSPEEKQKLAAKAVPKPVGAATALKPVAPQKLAPVPPHPVKPAPKLAPKIPASAPAAAVAPAVPRAGDAAPGAALTAPQR